MKLLQAIDHLLNNYTMYKVVMYGLFGLVGIALVMAWLEWLPFAFWQLILLLLLSISVSFVVHQLLQHLFASTYNAESGLITGLIFFFVLSPISSVTDLWVTVAVIAFGAVSKYVLAVDKKHLFNPVAVALVVMGLFGFGNAIWWVGSSVLLPFVFILGLAIVRKLRRFDLLFAFVVASLVTGAWVSRFDVDGVWSTWWNMLISWPLWFLGTVMLTEPLTGPASRWHYLLYGGVVGVFFASRFQLGPVHSTPELALVVGNLLAYCITKEVRLQLQLKRKRLIARDIYEFDFIPRGNFTFLPGQYLEWTIPAAGADSRGNRRYFTIASSPTEKVLSIAVKVDQHSSSFKRYLLAMPVTAPLVASQLAGDFVLPKDQQQKLVLIAGGIGITPFRSMARYLVDRRERRDVVLFYICSQPDEFAYDALWQEVQQYGWQVVLVITKRVAVPAKWTGEVGYLSAGMLKRRVPDYALRHFYLSGPNAMVTSYKKLLAKQGVGATQIKTDYFPGF